MDECALTEEEQQETELIKCTDNIINHLKDNK